MPQAGAATCPVMRGEFPTDIEHQALCSIDAQVAAEKKRKADEKAARARAEEERQATEDAEDKSAAQQRARELRNNVAFHREGPSPAHPPCPSTTLGQNQNKWSDRPPPMPSARPGITCCICLLGSELDEAHPAATALAAGGNDKLHQFSRSSA